MGCIEKLNSLPSALLTRKEMLDDFMSELTFSVQENCTVHAYTTTYERNSSRSGWLKQRPGSAFKYSGKKTTDRIYN